MKKKALAIALALCMVLSMLPMTAFAAQNTDSAVVKTAPVKLESLARDKAALEVQAKSYSVTLTSEGSGTTQLLTDSTAQANSEVYFVADPDDGYLANIYVDGVNPDEVYYLGMDVWGFVMPANKVTLKVVYVAAGGSSYSISVNSGEGGQYALSRTSAKEYESVYLGVKPDDASVFIPEEYVTVNNGSIYYLYEEEGIYYYELFMPASNVSISIIYSKQLVAYDVNITFEGNGHASVSPSTAYAGDTVTVMLAPDAGYELSYLYYVAQGNTVGQEAFTYVGSNQWTFVMPECDVQVYAGTKATINPVKLVMETTVGGAATVSVTEAKIGDTVTLTCTPEEGYRVAQITGVEYVDNGDNTYTFTMPGKAVEIHVWILREDNPFIDVHEPRFYYTPVMWAVEQGITKGITPTTFCPGNPCTRGQVVTFLWRASGSPEPTITEHPFTDVREGAFYYKAMLWAVENGITKGITDTTFDPDGICTRGHVVTFLYRTEQLPEPEPDPEPTDPSEPTEPAPTEPTEPDPTQPAGER